MKLINKIYNYFSLVKFSHTIFALPFALLGFFLGCSTVGNIINYKLFLLMLLCMVFARTAAMSFNRFIDKDIDYKNPRTASREIPRKVITPSNALIFCIINCILFVISTFCINRLCFYLSFVALTVVLFYSLTKRFTSLSHIVLGIGLSLSPIGAYLVVTGHFAVLPVLFSVIVLFWTSGFDILYSLQDEKFDREEKLNSIPARFGYKRSLYLSELFHLISVTFVIFAGISGGFGLFYRIGVVCFISMLIYQHFMVRKQGLTIINLYFTKINGYASLIFSFFVITDILHYSFKYF
ncbi:MAG: UbiA-like polyprenyltransferase [Bacteroidota bacterium]|nr:UbiA-like polyprenyltransferase [Bacteroidota bacterium]